MGNHGSRRDQRKWGKHGGKAANALSRVEELRGPSVDSYDKLIAWLAEMAESDNVELDTSMFVSQLNRVCGERSQNNYLDVDGAVGGASPAAASGGGSSGGNGKRSPNTRQNSASCDSHVSHASSDMTTPRQRGSTRSEDFLDPRSAWKSGVSTRQNTFSDDFEEEEDSDLKNASVESLYSSTDRDSELGSITAYEASSRRSGRNFNFPTCSPLLRATLANRLRHVERDFVSIPCSSSTGNLDIYDATEVSRLKLHPFVKRRSVSLLNLAHPEPMIPCENIPKLVLTREEDNNYGDELSHPPEMKNPRKKLGSGPRSLSTASSKKKPARFERQFSLHADPNALTTVTATGGVAHMFTSSKRDPEPDKRQETPAFLNDALLDGNIADILFSVEALWPKK